MPSEAVNWWANQPPHAWGEGRRHPAQPSNTRHRVRPNGLVCRRGAPGTHAASGEGKHLGSGGLARGWGFAQLSPRHVRTGHLGNGARVAHPSSGAGLTR
jgi:hypothetical protein